MKRIYIIAFLLLSGCISSKVDIDAANNGSQITINKGQTLIISLDANPTTGYTWEVAELNENILQKEGEIEYRPESGAIGSGGKQILHIKSVNTGKTEVKLVYRRPWEKDVKPANFFSLQVVVVS